MYSEPWFRKHDGWYTYHREGSKRRAVKLVRGKGSREVSFDLWHKLCAKPVDQPVVSGDSAVGFLDLYLAWVQKNRAPGTYDIYLHHLTSFSGSIGPELTIDQLKPKHVTQWLDSRTCGDSTKAASTRKVECGPRARVPAE